MNSNTFLRGMGLGMALGTAVTLACTPRPMTLRRSPAGKAVKAVTDWMEQMGGNLGL